MWTDDLYDFLFSGDTDNKFLVRNPYATLSLVGFYVLFVKWIGPMVMKDRKPFGLKKTIIAYNMAQVIFNFYIAYSFFTYLILIWKYKCLIQYHPNYETIWRNISNIGWCTFLVKLMDFLDTVFFVLRKKDNQVSFLHVSHHACMCLLFYFGFKHLRFGFYIPVSLTINCTIHVVMYSYYTLAAFGPHMQKYLWWKKYLTLMQMTQFSFILVWLSVGFATGCEEVGVLELNLFAFVALMLILFANFYRKSFKKD